MENGICHKCGSTKVKKESNKKLKMWIALQAVNVAFLLGSIVTYVYAYATKQTTILGYGVLGFMLSLSAVCFCKYGIEKSLK